MSDALDSSVPDKRAQRDDAGERAHYSVSQAAELLGVNRVTVWRWISEGRLPAARLGHRTTRIKYQDLEQFFVQRASANSGSRPAKDARTGAATGKGVEGMPLTHRAEDEVRRSEAEARRQLRLYEAILTNTPDLACVLDLNHRFIYANEGLLKAWGRTREEAIGKTYLELGNPDWHVAMHDREIDQVIATKQPIRGEVPFAGTFGRRVYDYIFAPVFGADGEVEAVAGTARDVTERTRTEALQLVEARVLEMVAGRMPLARVLAELARTLEALADGMLVSVLLLDEDGRHLRHGAAPSLPDTYNRAIDGIEVGPAAGSCGTAAFRRERVVVTDIAVDPLWADFREFGLAHGLRACWSTPIRDAAGRVLGTFALYYRAPREPSPGDLELIDRVARVAGLAIERARAEDERASLLKREREARAEAEALLRVGQELSAELGLEKLLQAATDAATELSGAQYGTFFYNVVNEQGEAHMLYTVSGAPRKAFATPPMPRDPEMLTSPFSDEGIVRLDDVSKDPRFGTDRPYYGMPEGHLPVRSYLAVPVLSRGGEVLGGLFLSHTDPGVFTERAERVVVGIAGQAAVALENAHLYESERAVRADAQRATARARHLQQITGQLSRSLDVDEMLAGIARSAADLLGVSVGAVFLLDSGEPEGDFALAAASGIDATRRRELRLPRHASLAGQAIDQGQTLIVNDVSKASGTALPELLTGETVGSEIAAPITAGNERLGVIKAFSLVVRRFSSDDAELLNALADAAAVALINARLYRRVQDSLRMRDEFLSAAAHDLKTPLTSVKGMSQLLRRQAERGSIADSARLVEGLTTIDAAATQMGQQLDELLDLTRLQMGRPLDLQRQPADLVKLARRVATEQQQTTDRHRLQVEGMQSELVGGWDAARLARVLNNLIGNAIKYSPEGGDVTITVGREGDGAGEQAVVTVRDQGVGIPAADLPRIFERFQRAGNVGQIAGTGIGLASVRQIVEQHGGTISAESHEGTGSAFIVRLPLGIGDDEQE